MYIHGSRARGDFNEWSDVDLVLSCPDADQEDWLKVREIIDNADILVDVD